MTVPLQVFQQWRCEESEGFYSLWANSLSLKISDTLSTRHSWLWKVQHQLLECFPRQQFPGKIESKNHDHSGIKSLWNYLSKIDKSLQEQLICGKPIGQGCDQVVESRIFQKSDARLCKINWDDGLIFFLSHIRDLCTISCKRSLIVAYFTVVHKQSGDVIGLQFKQTKKQENRPTGK